MKRIFAFVFALSGLFVEARADALFDAVKAGDSAAAERAISGGADVNMRTGLFTPLVAAIRNGDHNIAALLLEKGADPNGISGSNSPLSVACDRSDPNLVQLLLDKGADAKLSNNGVTALHRAAEAGCLKCVERLLQAGADVNALTELGTPAIHLATIAGHQEVSAYLAKRGYAPPSLPPIAAALGSADLSRGKSLYEKNCGGCHRVTDKPTGPSLAGIAGRPKGTLRGSDYSEAMKSAGAIGVTTISMDLLHTQQLSCRERPCRSAV